MLYLLKFKNENGKEFFLHNGTDSFIGGHSIEGARQSAPVAILLWNGSMEVVEVPDGSSIANLIDYHPVEGYKIFDFFCNGTRWHGVPLKEIKNEGS